MTGTIPEGLYLDSYKTDPTTLSVSARSRWWPAWRASWRGWINPALSERRMERIVPR